MSYIRAASIPIEHLAAEMAAFPIASEASFRISPIELCPFLAARRFAGSSAAEKTGTLWRETEQSLISATPAISLDELVKLRDRIWFPWEEKLGPPRSVSLGEFLRRLAESHLRIRGSTAAPCQKSAGVTVDTDSESQGKAQAREAWRWLSFALPPDLLLAALHRDGRMPTCIEQLSPQMERMLQDRGFAETHLHLGAALDSRLLWVSLLWALAQTDIKQSAFASPGAAFNEGKEFAPWLLRGAIARYVLAAFLNQRTGNTAEIGSFAGYVQSVVLPRVRQRLGLAQAVLLRVALNELAAGRPAPQRPTFGGLRALYAALTGVLAAPRPFQTSQANRVTSPQLQRFTESSLVNLQHYDPVARFFLPLGSDGPTSEMRFTACAMDYLEGHPQDTCTDRGFAVLFWQVVRLRNLFYRHVVQRPLTPGLQWFIRTYSRLSPARNPLLSASSLVRSAANVSGLGKGLRSMEIRTSPESDTSRLLRLVDTVSRTFQEQVRVRRSPRQTRGEDFATLGPCDGQFDNRVSHGDDTNVEFALVLHLTKRRGGGAERGLPKAHWTDSHADPSIRLETAGRRGGTANPTGYRFAHFYNTVRRDVLTVGRVLTAFPLTLAVVRGIDVCTDELAIPTWVCVPLFRYLREVSFRTSAVLQSRFGLSVPPLRTTAHVGEDFVHLTGGLRRIDEAIRYLGLREGDRIGHGVALGIDVEQWSRSAGRVPIEREERLFDLLWEWTCYAKHRVKVDVDRRAYLERELARLSGAVFGWTLDAFELETLVDLLHQENALRNAGFPNGTRTPRLPVSLASPSDRRRRRLFRCMKQYLTNPSIFRRGHVIEWIEPVQDARALENLQEFLRNRVASQGLTIEVNPSSNLLIANLTDLVRHPLWRLNPPTGDASVSPIPICVGSDDPITFATGLREEYMLLHDAALRAGLSYEQVSNWLEVVRASGLNARFSLPRLFEGRISNIRRGVGASLPPPV